jgi:hypothetical protein
MEIEVAVRAVDKRRSLTSRELVKEGELQVVGQKN